MAIGTDGKQTLLGTKSEMYAEFPDGNNHPELPAYQPFYIAEGDGKGDLYMWSVENLAWVKQ